MSRRLTRRTWAALAILLLAIPALMAVFVCVWDERKYYLTSLLLVGLMFVPFVLRFEGRRPQARELVLLSTHWPWPDARRFTGCRSVSPCARS